MECESWTLKENEENIIKAFENKCARKIMRIHSMAKNDDYWTSL